MKVRSDNAAAWGLPGVLDYFRGNRRATSDVYPSEWYFLKDRLREGMTILDVGCAQGGFAGIVAEHVNAFTYVGTEINPEMVAIAKAKYPHHQFHLVREGAFSLPNAKRFDVVLVLGILHLHETWRETLRSAWSYTEADMIFDLRETTGQTVEDIERSYMKMDFGGGDSRHSQSRVPYIVVNESEAAQTVRSICSDSTKIDCYGYAHKASPSAVTPFDQITTRVWCATR